MLPTAHGHAQESPLPAPRTITPNSNDEIAYIDVNGYIRTYDPDQPEVEWVSPTAGWRYLALGDVNGDGDMEIVAVAGGDSDGRVAVFDPVVAAGEVNAANNYAGDVYWDVLYESALPGGPQLVTTGAYLATSSGTPTGFAVVYADPSAPDGAGNETRIRVFVPDSVPPDGRQWRVLADHERNASRITSGDVDNDGVDDLVIVDRVRRVDSELIALSVRADGTYVRLFDDEDLDIEEWVDAAVGRVMGSDAPDDTVAIREASLTTPLALHVLRYLSPRNAVSVYARSFLPAPFTVFLGDVLNDGVDEMFFLRTVTCNPANAVSSSNQPQLFLRSAVEGSALSFEICLDADNAFRSGATGDFDGDNKAEVVVLSQYQLRIFDQPDVNTQSSTVAVAANPALIVAGNLDTNGNATTARLSATMSSVDILMQSGTRIGPINIQIYNGGTQDAIDFSVAVIPTVPFLTWSVSGAQTNANLTLYLDASTLLPGGIYGTNIVITAQTTEVANSPLIIPVIVHATGIALNPAQTLVMTYPCDRSSGPLEPISMTLTVAGDVTSWGKTFSVTVEAPSSGLVTGVVPRADWPSNVPWVAASSPTTTVPSTLEIVLDPNNAANSDAALIVLRSPLDANSQLQYVSGLHYRCTNHAAFMPLIAKY